MIRFKDNPNLENRKVKTVKGITEYRQNCRNIKDKWYVKDEDCFLINGKWHTFTSKEVALDHETGKYRPIDKTLVYGVVGFKESDSSPIFGYFTENRYNNLTVNVPEYGKVKTVNELILTQNGFVESINNGAWLLKKNLTANELARINNIEQAKVYTHKGYNIEDNAEEFRQKTESFNKYPVKISAAAMRYSKMLNGASFGMEVETAKGVIPDHIQNRTGIVVCRDGSIKNAEYVTVPMSGAKGLVNIKYLSEELCKRTTTDISCSLHFHIGNLPKDRLFIVALYALALRIQDELFTMFPYYKTKWEGVKNKDYNKKLRKLGTGLMKPDMNKEAYQKYVDEAYYRIFIWLNDGVPPDDNYNRKENHHLKVNKWERKQRYFWLNFMNMFFSERRTMEFRLHHCTLNGQKMINWLFICNAICQYAAKNSELVLSSSKPISLDEVLGHYENTYKTVHGKFLTNYLKAYVKDRKDYFAADLKKGDIVSQKEMDNDKEYVFTHEGVSWLF